VHGYDGIDRILVQVSLLAVVKSLLRTNFVVSLEKVDQQRILLEMTKSATRQLSHPPCAEELYTYMGYPYTQTNHFERVR
jgi:hypothetical protein